MEVRFENTKKRRQKKDNELRIRMNLQNLNFSNC